MLKSNQKTLKEKIELKGVGLHNGLEVNLTIKPAQSNTGIIFKRVDINNNNIIHANFKNVVEPILCTKLKNEKGVISTVEHLIAFSEGIDNALVEVDASEFHYGWIGIDFVDAIRSGLKSKKNLKNSLKF